MSSTSETRRGICPSTEEPLWESPVSTQEDVDQAVSAAKAAYPAWRKLSWDERANYLVKFADAIEAHKQEFIELLGREAGKPPQAGGFELMLVMEHIRKTPKLRIKEDKPEENEDVRATSVIAVTRKGLIICKENSRCALRSLRRRHRHRSMELPHVAGHWKSVPCHAGW